MDPEERRQIARRGGQASHGGRGGYQEEEYDQDYDADEVFVVNILYDHAARLRSYELLAHAFA